MLFKYYEIGLVVKRKIISVDYNSDCYLSNNIYRDCKKVDFQTLYKLNNYVDDFAKEISHYIKSCMLANIAFKESVFYNQLPFDIAEQISDLDFKNEIRLYILSDSKFATISKEVKNDSEQDYDVIVTINGSMQL
mgnify:CR=1 FL=1